MININKKISLINTNKLYKKIVQQKTLLFMSLPFVIHVLIFEYIPIWGWIMAFQKYQPGRSLFEQEWVGIHNFVILFSDDIFYQVLRNTLVMSFIKIFFGMISSIILAIIINELRYIVLKKTVQIISFLPHLISWVVAANLITNALSVEGGIINKMLIGLHIIEKPIMFLGIPELFWAIIGLTHIWKEIGWGAIIFLAAISSIDSSLYEIATIDGANRLQKIWYITLPAIKTIIVIILLIKVGLIMNTGFKQQFLLSNSIVIDYARVFRIFEMDYGLKMMRFSFATAAGIFKSIISIFLFFSANFIARKFGEDGLI